MLSDLVIFLILSSEIPLDFHNSIRVVLVKYVMYCLTGINTKSFRNIPRENYFAPLKILYLSIKYVVNPFVDIATFFESSFNSFLFYVTSFSYQNLSFFYKISNITFSC